MNPMTLAIDIGGSKYMVGLVGRDGGIVAKRRFMWADVTADGVVSEIIRSACALLAAHPDERPASAGVTIPGVADPARGLWVEASFSGIRDVPVARLLSDALSLPVYIDNDGQACALAEKLFGACRDINEFLYVTVSNGIGGAVFAGGRLLSGANGAAGEIGHCVVVEDGRLCGCGSRGCLEMYAAGPAIARRYAEAGGAPLPDGRMPGADAIAERARAGDAVALATFTRQGEVLGRALAAACNLLNPAKVIIGGGVSLAFSLFEAPLRAMLDRNLYRAANPNLVIEPTALGYDGGLLGAAAVAFARRERLYGYD